MTQILWQALGDPSGLPALSVHCALGRGRDLGRMLSLLPLDAQALDLPGHGASSAWDGAGDYHTACTQAALTGLDRRRIVIGHSLGATIALRMALMAPARIQALVLIEPVLFAAARGTPEHADHAVHDAQFARQMQAGDLAAAAAGFVGVWGTGLAFASMPVTERTRIMAQMPLNAATAPALFDDSADMLRAGGLEGLRAPVLLLRGARSPAITGAIHAALAARLPCARCAEIPSAGHMAPLTHYQDVAAAIARFLDTL